MTYLLVATALALGSIQVEIETLDGRKTSGTLTEWTAEAVVVATDDGTLGHKGLVTDLLTPHLSSQEPPTLYACGPLAMLEAVQRLALAANVPAFLCMEELMACGFGACLGCAIPTHDPEVVRYCCTDGPVFDAKEIVLEP